MESHKSDCYVMRIMPFVENEAIVSWLQRYFHNSHNHCNILRCLFSALCEPIAKCVNADFLASGDMFILNDFRFDGLGHLIEPIFFLFSFAKILWVAINSCVELCAHCTELVSTA